MKNVTITIEDDVARWARVWAARQGVSLSRLVSDWLRRAQRQEEGYEQAMERFLSVEPSPLKTDGGYPARSSLHER